MLLLPHIIILAYYDDDRNRGDLGVSVRFVVCGVEEVAMVKVCDQFVGHTACCCEVCGGELGRKRAGWRFFFLGCRRTIL